MNMIEEVNLFDIYSLKEAYLKLNSYNEHIILEYKALKRKFKTSNTELEQHVWKKAGLSHMNVKLSKENKNLKSSLKTKNVELDKAQKELYLINVRLSKRPMEESNYKSRKFRNRKLCFREDSLSIWHLLKVFRSLSKKFKEIIW